YRKLIKVTQTDKWPIPDPRDIFDRLRDSSWFTLFDLKFGYYQIEMDENSIDKTAFSTPDGHYEFLVTPFGYKNAPVDFSRIMKEILGDLIKFVESFIDNITVHSKTFEEHIEHIKIVLSCLSEAKLKLNPEKCVWFARSVNILGHIVSKNEIMMDPSKIDAIKNRLAPRTVKQLQSFIGLCNFYRRFVLMFSYIAQPIFTLLNKDNKFIWTAECKEIFIELKNALTSYPILRIVDPNRPLKAYTDASGLAIEEKECLSVIECKREWRNYGDIEFVVDHYALQWLSSIKNLQGRLGRWSLELQEIDLKVTYRPGKLNGNADAISRPVINFIVDQVDIEKEPKSRDPYKNVLLKELIITKKVRSSISKKFANKLQNIAKSYAFDGKEIFMVKNNIHLIYPDIDERKEIINKAHAFGHFQSESTYNRIKDDYYWHGMVDGIKQSIKECKPCQRNNKTITKDHPAQVSQVSNIFKRVD
ncbi:unnamed protein product, partial [Brachionus calyciflorus]